VFSLSVKTRLVHSEIGPYVNAGDSLELGSSTSFTHVWPGATEYLRSIVFYPFAFKTFYCGVFYRGSSVPSTRMFLVKNYSLAPFLHCPSSVIPYFSQFPPGTLTQKNLFGSDMVCTNSDGTLPPLSRALCCFAPINFA